MPAASYNFLIEQGSEHSILFKYLDINGNPVDLSGKCVILRWLDSNNNILTFSSATTASLDNASGYSLTADNEGLITFKIAASRTKDYNFTTAVYDLDIVENTGTFVKNTRVLTGTIGLVTRNFSLCENCALINADPSVPLSNDNIIVTVTPTVTPSGTPTTPTPLPTGIENDLCLPEDCISLDIFSQVYSGSGLTLYDNQNNSGTIIVTNTGIIENVELAVNGLKHSSPQDLVFILSPPSGSGILLSANSKISNYQNNFSFMFSNKASSGNYLYNTTNGGLCNIVNKTTNYRFNDNSLTYSFDHLFNNSITGVWTFYANDTDITTSGSIDSWKLILTYTNTDEGSSE
jgi:subtilisin-like proprotein convertase family protein